MNTTEMVQIALELAQLEELPLDSSVSVPGENITRVLAGIDMGAAELTLACQLRKPTHEYGHWYALVVNENGEKVENGFLGIVGGEGSPADDWAEHYSVAGYLEYARWGL